MDKVTHIAECQEPWIYWWKTLSVADKIRLLHVHVPKLTLGIAEFGFGGELVDPVWIRMIWEAKRPDPLEDHQWIMLAFDTFACVGKYNETEDREIWRQVYRIASDRI